MLNWLKKSKQVLGMNSRNLQFIKPGNSKKAVRLVDDKLRTKKLLQKNGLPVSNLIAVIKNRKQFYNFDWQNLPNSFVLKPNRGLGGEGIMVTYGKTKQGKWILPREKVASLKDIILRVSNILDGDFSKTNIPDTAFFEERLKIHSAFKLYSYKGVPDARIIVYNKVPIMAMLRLPTKSSGGKANLHKGGVGIGIDIITGKTTYAIQNDSLITTLTDLKLSLRGLQIPQWEKILQISVEATIASGLNYCGVDVAIDKERGPVIVELNAHPGLSIQNCNLIPLRERLNRVSGLKIKTVSKGIKVAKELYNSDSDLEINEFAGRKIIGVINKIKVKDRKNKWVNMEAKMDTGAGISSIDESMARQLGFDEAIDFFNSFNIKNVLTNEEVERLKADKVYEKIITHKDIVDCGIIYSSHGISYRIEIPLKIEINNVCLNINATVFQRGHLKYPIIIGKRDLKNFLIDPNK